jgi:hypothetical protein
MNNFTEGGRQGRRGEGRRKERAKERSNRKKKKLISDLTCLYIFPEIISKLISSLLEWLATLTFIQNTNFNKIFISQY